MILNGQHSVNCFHYAPMGMHFKINSVPDPSCEASRLDIHKSTWMVMFPLLSCDVLGSELSWNCFIKHHKDNYHKVVPFLCIQIVLFVRIMCDHAEICKLCNWMQFLINYAGLHHRKIFLCFNTKTTWHKHDLIHFWLTVIKEAVENNKSFYWNSKLNLSTS